MRRISISEPAVYLRPTWSSIGRCVRNLYGCQSAAGWRDALFRCRPSSGARSVSANGARFAGVRPHAERPNERRTTTRTASAPASEPRERAGRGASAQALSRRQSREARRRPASWRRWWSGSGRQAGVPRHPSAGRCSATSVPAEAAVVTDAGRQGVRVCFQRSLGRSRGGRTRAIAPVFAQHVRAQKAHPHRLRASTRTSAARTALRRGRLLCAALGAPRRPHAAAT